MAKKSPKRTRPAASKALVPKRSAANDFDEVIGLIEAARARAYAAVNRELIDLYWQVGKYISRKLESAAWGEGIVQQLADYIAQRHPDLKGFTRASLFRMRQFYDVYNENEIVAPLVRQLSWTHNLLILSRSKLPEEREFYLKMAIRERWTKRELQRQLDSALFERTVLSPPKVSPLLTQLHPDALSAFKDTYIFDFLRLPEPHNEQDLQQALIANLKRFLLELGGDFTFIGQNFRVQVGIRDFFIDLLFFHRGLNCLVAFELKVEEFQPEHLGKLEFYLESLDRDVKKAHEAPSIGVLLCATQDKEVVEYELSRSVSPAVVAEYQAHLPDKKLLRAKLHEFYELAQAQMERSALEDKTPPAAKSPSKTRRTPRIQRKGQPS